MGQLQTVDQATLTPLVHQALGSTSVELSDWRVESLHGGAGNVMGLSGVYRFAGSGSDQGKPVAWSLVLKVVNRPASAEEPSAWFYWKREVLAYQSGLLADLPGGVVAPRCFGVVEQAGGTSWLWLEEITDAAGGRWPLERFALVARRLGAFNAAYLTGRPTPSYPWLSHDWFRSRVATAEGAIAQLPTVLDHPLVRRAFPGDTAPRVLQLWADRATFFDALDQLPQTFCHLDAYPRNLFVRDDLKGDGRIVAIDWAFAGVSALGADLAALVGASLTFDEADLSTARELDQVVFASYLEGLQAAGVARRQANRPLRVHDSGRAPLCFRRPAVHPRRGTGQESAR